MSSTNNRILYLEDDPEMISQLQDYFESKGYEVRFEKTNIGLQHILETYRPRIVIVDDDLDGTTPFAVISQDVKRVFGHSDFAITLIGCTSEETGLRSKKVEYKHEGYLDFLPNSGSEEHLGGICRVIDKILGKN